MNSVAGNKERLAVSTRGKKYGVSCGGVYAEMRSQGPIRAGVPREPAAGARSPALGCTGVSTGGAVHARRRVCSSPGSGNVLDPRFLPFPAPLTFAVFRDLKAELNRRGAFPRNSSAVPWARCPGAGSPIHLPAGPGGLCSE